MTVELVKGNFFLRQRQVELLLTLDRTRHLGKAAEELHISQPAASKALAQLEEQLGHPLFFRGGSGTTPTALGGLLVNHARSLAGAANRVAEELEAVVQRGHQILRIGILPSTSIHITPRLVTALLARNSELEISITEGLLHELLTRLTGYELDCVIGRTTSRFESEEVEGRFLYEDPIALVAGVNNRVVLGPDIDIEQIARMPWILPVHDSVLRERVDEMFFRMGLSRPKRYIESNAVLTNVILVNQHDWIVALPSVIAQYFEEQGRVRILPFETNSNAGNVEVMTRRNDVVSPALGLALEILTELFPGSTRISAENANISV